MAKELNTQAVTYDFSGVRHIRIHVSGDKVRWLRFEGGRRYVEVLDQSLIAGYDKMAKFKPEPVEKISKIEEPEEIEEIEEEEEEEEESEEVEE